MTNTDSWGEEYVNGIPQGLSDFVDCPYYSACLLLNQTTPQNVINGSPQFDEGITIKADKWINMDGV